MTAESGLHHYLNWTKERIDEMDAAVASLEASARRVQTSSMEGADRLIAALRKQRSEFQAEAKAHAEASEAALHSSKAQLEAQWHAFEAQVRTYFDTVGKQLEQQRATFRDVAAAQVKAWRQAADRLHEDATKVAAARRAEIDDALEEMKAQLIEVEARLEKLKQAGGESWVTLSSALAESRKVFDSAIQKASEAFKRASSR